MKRAVVWLPIVALVAFVGLFTYGLARPKDDFVRSKMVGKVLPAFVLPPAIPGQAGVASTAIRGRAQLINIFASWCLPCQAEAPHLIALRQRGVPIVGVAVKDSPAALQRFLKRNGNPFTSIGADDSGRVQLLLGSSGVPESYVIGRDGRILYQHIGDIRAEDVPRIAAMVKAAP